LPTTETTRRRTTTTSTQTTSVTIQTTSNSSSVTLSSSKVFIKSTLSSSVFKSTPSKATVPLTALTTPPSTPIVSTVKTTIKTPSGLPDQEQTSSPPTTKTTLKTNKCPSIKGKNSSPPTTNTTLETDKCQSPKGITSSPPTTKTTLKINKCPSAKGTTSSPPTTKTTLKTNKCPSSKGTTSSPPTTKTTLKINKCPSAKGTTSSPPTTNTTLKGNNCPSAKETTNSPPTTKTTLKTNKCPSAKGTTSSPPTTNTTLKTNKCPSIKGRTSSPPTTNTTLKTNKCPSIKGTTSSPPTTNTTLKTNKCPSTKGRTSSPPTTNTTLKRNKCPSAKGTTSSPPTTNTTLKTNKCPSTKGTTSSPPTTNTTLKTNKCPSAKGTTSSPPTTKTTLTTTSILSSLKKEATVLPTNKTTRNPSRNSRFRNTQCWTDWFDQDNPSGNGDQEILSYLQYKNPGKICNKPLQIEVQTTAGLSVSVTGDLIEADDTAKGFICMNSDQTQGPCQDYRVRFMCPADFCSENGNRPTRETTTNLSTKAPENNQQTNSSHTNTDCWTGWFDRDNPSGIGDLEILSVLQYENPAKICNKPLQIEVQTTAGLSAAATGDVIEVADVNTGFICKNSAQAQGTCQDYRVRFMCPSNFCSQQVCWTIWFDRDNPSGFGDRELLQDLKKENPGVICDRPLYIDVVTTDTNATAISTGQSFHTYSPTEGFKCRNKDQHRGRCRDYKVRFGCPCQ
ncbi:mucin-5AC, partial [Notolabrus celidotus]|uniref:mucin-5AC n=1 Tax=Notolabrus celidotus TaxID=1203425 RepID=UPI00149042CB